MENTFISKTLKKLIITTAIGSLLVFSNPLAEQVAKAIDLATLSTVKKSQFYIGPGVNHSSFTLKNSSNHEAINTLEVDPKNKYIRLLVTSPNDRVLSLNTVRNQAKQIDQDGHRVIAAFNSDFFKTASPYAGQPIGLQINNGEIITTPSTSKSVLSIGKDKGAAIFEQVKMTSKLQITGVNGDMALSGINRARNKDTQKNSLILFTSSFSSSTKTSGDEVEFLLNPNNKVISPNQTLSATIEEVMESNDSPIPPGKWVLSATGKQADWLTENLTIGSEVQLQVNFNQALDEAAYAVSGGELLLRDGMVTSNAVNDQSGRHPRTMVSTKQGKLYITTFDGRQPGYSDGVTLEEGAEYLEGKGMDAAMNMDGGGSTTYAIRLPGEQSLSILNRPSDGNERRVSNSLMVVSTAPISSLAKLTSQVGDTIKVLAKAKVPIKFKGQDKYYNGVPVDNKKLTWTTTSSIGKMDSIGTFTAGTKAAKGKITAKSGNASKSIIVEVVTSLAKIAISPQDALIIPGRKQTFKVKGYDSKGKEVTLTPDLLKWETKGSIGKLDSKGTLSSVNRIEKGKVIVSYGKTKAETTINVGKSPTTLEDFENIKDVQVSSARSVLVSGSLMSSPKPIKVGSHSMSLSYDFTGMTGTSAAYINFKDKNGLIGRPIESRPVKIEMWVYGDENNHWLRGSLVDGSGKSVTIDFTTQGKLDWKGWKKVYATIPANTPTPIKLKQVYVVEPSSTNKNKGILYFDHLKAIYTEIE